MMRWIWNLHVQCIHVVASVLVLATMAADLNIVLMVVQGGANQGSLPYAECLANKGFLNVSEEVKHGLNATARTAAAADGWRWHPDEGIGGRRGLCGAV